MFVHPLKIKTITGNLIEVDHHINTKTFYCWFKCIDGKIYRCLTQEYDLLKQHRAYCNVLTENND